MKEIYSDDHLSIFNNKDWLYLEWTGFQLKESAPKGCMEVLKGLHKYKVSKILNDNTNKKGLWDAKWIAHDCFPNMVKAGLKKFAWVLSTDKLCAGEVNEVLLSSPVAHVIKTFKNLEEAKLWLLKDDEG